MNIEEFDERLIIEYITLIKQHDEELKTFRKSLEHRLMDYMVESIVKLKKSR